MSFVLERLTELRRHLDHLTGLRPRVAGVEALQNDLSLRNNVFRSLQVVCHSVIGIAAELSVRKDLRFEDHKGAILNLASYPEFSSAVIQHLQSLPDLQNMLIYDYVAPDFERAIAALNGLNPIEEFVETVRRIEVAET